MATLTGTTAPDVLTLASYRKWVQFVHDAFLAMGWVKTADTGQADPATIALPGTAANTYTGFEIFRMNDVLQATAPVFVKVEYGRGGATVNAASVAVTVGRGTDGAGVIIGVLFLRTMVNATTTGGSATEYPCYASGDTGSICLAMWPVLSGNSTFLFAIERSRDTGGASTADALLIVLASNGANSANGSVCVIGYTGTVDSAKSAKANRVTVGFPQIINGVTVGVSTSLSADGATAPVLPIPCMAPGVTPWVSNILVAVAPGDAGAVSVITAATINGSVRTYRAWPLVFTNGIVQLGATTNGWPAIIWEA